MHVFWLIRTWDARFCMFLHVCAHCLYLRYTNTCYKVQTFSSTDFLFLNTGLHTTDLIIHDFELHELFNSPKNVHLKALLYMLSCHFTIISKYFDIVRYLKWEVSFAPISFEIQQMSFELITFNHLRYHFTCHLSCKYS